MAQGDEQRRYFTGAAPFVAEELDDIVEPAPSPDEVRLRRRERAWRGDLRKVFRGIDVRRRVRRQIVCYVAIVRQAGFTVSNVDAVVIAEQPKIFPYIERMRQTLAAAMGIDVSAVSVKGKTNEKIGALGRNEAIAVHAVAMLRKT